MAIFNVGNRIIEPGTWPWGYDYVSADDFWQYGLFFDGMARYVQVPALPALSNQYTLEIWFTVSEAANEYPQLLGKEFVFSVLCGAGQPLKLIFGTGSNWIGSWITTDFTPLSGLKYHLALINNEGSLTLVVNQQVFSPFSIPSSTLNTSFCLGKREGQSAADYAFLGQIAGFRAWATVLTPTVLTSNHTEGPGLIAKYLLGEMGGVIAIDSSGALNHATLYNPLWISNLGDL
jgi:hypothetical protein